MRNGEIKVGLVVGRLVVAGPGARPRHWRCQCECGAEKDVYAGNLGANTFSCGCRISERRVKHGATAGGRQSPEFRAWCAIIDRCTRPTSGEWDNYGARGIRICDAWRHEFAAFLSHIGPRPGRGFEIDRIDNDGNYEPGNVRWVTKKLNNRNRRNNHWVVFLGRRMTLAEAIELSSVHPGTVRVRISKGWSAERALTQPTQKAGDHAAS